MTSKPIFSVIIPTHNTGHLITATLNSLVNQTFKNFEVIISDDGSTDNTLELIEPFKNLLRMNVICSQNWGGPARPRNIGIRAAQGEWIAFLDHDDLWTQDKLQIVNGHLNKADLIFHDLFLFNLNGKKSKIIRGRNLKDYPFENLMIKGNAIINSSVVVKKIFIENAHYIDESKELITVEDYDLWLKISLLKARFLYIPKQMGYYRIIENQNMSSANIKQIIRHKAVILKHIHKLNPKGQKKAIAMLAYGNARIYHKLNKFSDARLDYLRALSAESYYIKLKAVLGLILTYFH